MNSMPSIEHEELRARDDMARRRILPAVSYALAEGLAAIGVIVDGPEADGSRIKVLPAGWSIETDALNHRAWHLLDERSVRRVSCFWKAGGLFTSAAGYGSTSINGPEADTGIVRTWDAENSEHAVIRLRRRVRISCGRCRKREEWGGEFDLRTMGERPAFVADVVTRGEADFRRRHVCA